MKLFLRTLLLLTLITPASRIMAHSDHGKIDEQTAIQIAGKTVQQMTFKEMGYGVGKLDASWKAVQENDIELAGVEGDYYLLLVTHSGSKKALSLKIAFSGQVLDATFLTDKN